MKARHRRLMFIVIGLAALSGATALVLRALSDNVTFFFSPTQVHAEQAPRDAAFRLGGLVELDSLRRDADGLSVRFIVTDETQRIPVTYRGLLPDLFKEGKGVVVSGRLAHDGSFTATEVLAKHDENYMPPEAAQALERGRAKKTGTGVQP
ncbi:cytochrome c maturation protein CcmE [Roseateles sp.]|uniref:cytochrome c maturation protein CcmE n=1 Tax=Roseateles sp. TaxID=1971397 RepID=UPI0031DCF1E2